MINTFDHRDLNGNNLKLSPLHGLEIAPGFKLIGQCNKYQPYILANFSWNFFSKEHYKFNEELIKEVKVKPYVQYGIGLNHKKNDGTSFYGQLLFKNGGVNEVSIQGGMKWTF